jgi:hypothetical protein
MTRRIAADAPISHDLLPLERWRVRHGLDPTTFPQCSLLAANLAGMEELV